MRTPRQEVWIGWTRPTAKHPWRAVSRERTQAAAYNAAMAQTDIGDLVALPYGQVPRPAPPRPRGQ
jgi:hypothetical protein